MATRRTPRPRQEVKSAFASTVQNEMAGRFSDSRFNISELADSLDVSRQYLYEFCMMRFGRSPHDILEELRIQKGMGLLRSGERSLFKICAECGYANYQTFRKAFRKRLGMSPSVCRNAQMDVNTIEESLKKVPDVLTSENQQ